MTQDLQKTNKEDFSSLHDIIHSQLKSLVGNRFSSSLAIQKKWTEIVGTVIAHQSQILYVKNKTLYVGVDNSTWNNELSLMKDKIIQRINKMIPDITVKEVKFKIRPKY